MNRTTALAVSLALILSACIPAIPFPQLTTATPQVEEPPPSSTVESTIVVELTEVESPTATGSATASSSPGPTTTLSETMVVETQDSGTLTSIADTQAAPTLQAEQALTATSSPTSTLANDVTSIPLATETLYARFFGTLPPAIPYGQIWLKNKAKAEVYISMQCITVGGNKTILEYPVGSPAKISAPAGRYSYVVWVGGRQILGAFALDSQEELTITIYKNRVTIKD